METVEQRHCDIEEAVYLSVYSSSFGLFRHSAPAGEYEDERGSHNLVKSEIESTKTRGRTAVVPKEHLRKYCVKVLAAI